MSSYEVKIGCARVMLVFVKIKIFNVPRECSEVCSKPNQLLDWPDKSKITSCLSYLMGA